MERGQTSTFRLTMPGSGHHDRLMARKVRLEFEGAIYHIINRGNYRVAIAALLKRKTQASNPWIAEKLQMGNPKGISHYVGRLHSGKIIGQNLYELLDEKIEVRPRSAILERIQQL